MNKTKLSILILVCMLGIALVAVSVIASNPTTGRCCYGTNTCEADVESSYCSGLGGRFAASEVCPCPTAAPTQTNNCLSFGLEIFY